MPKLGMEAIRRRQIMDAVIQILSTQGWRDLTIREVSEVAGVSSGVVTHYFGSKRTMIIDAIVDANRQFLKALGEIERKRGGAQVRIAALVDLVSRPGTGLPDWRFWVGLYGRIPFDRVLQSETQKLHRRFAEIVVRLIEQGRAEDELAGDDPSADVAARFIALVSGLNAMRAADPDEVDHDRFRRLIIETLANDLGIKLSSLQPASDGSVRGPKG